MSPSPKAFPAFLIAAILMTGTAIGHAGEDHSEPVKLTAAGTTPDSPFYFFDRLSERAQLMTASGPKKVKMQLKFAEERLSEMKKVDSNSTKDQLSKDYAETVSNAKKQALGLKGSERDAAEEAVNQTVSRHTEVLESLKTRLPQQALTGLETALGGPMMDSPPMPGSDSAGQDAGSPEVERNSSRDTGYIGTGRVVFN